MVYRTHPTERAYYCHVKRLGAPGQALADMAKTQYGELFASELIKPGTLPLRVSGLLVKLPKLLCKIKHGTNCILTHRRTMHPTALRHKRGGFIKIHFPDLFDPSRKKMYPTIVAQS